MEISESLALVLAKKILAEMAEAGANQTEAVCALQVALALVPDMGLRPAPMLTVQT